MALTAGKPVKEYTDSIEREGRMTENEQTQEQIQARKFVARPEDLEFVQPGQFAEVETKMEQEFKLDGRTKRALDTAIAKKQVSQASYKAVTEGRIDLAKAKELGREGSPDPVGPAPKKVNKKDRSRECMCQCGQLTRGGRFIPGHDMRLVTFAKEHIRGERELTDEQLAYVQESGKLKRAQDQVAKEEAKKAERAAKKAEKQRQKEGEQEKAKQK